MKLKVKFIDLDVVDCTADPHPVGFKAKGCCLMPSFESPCHPW